MCNISEELADIMIYAGMFVDTRWLILNEPVLL
jgi:hypothetical protein